MRKDVRGGRDQSAIEKQKERHGGVGTPQSANNYKRNKSASMTQRLLRAPAIQKIKSVDGSRNGGGYTFSVFSLAQKAWTCWRASSLWRWRSSLSFSRRS